MTDPAALGDRSAFAARLRLQLTARYHGVAVDVDDARFALRIHGPGVDTMLPLAPLHHAVVREPARAPALIAQFVAAAEQQLTPRMATTFSSARLLWCVRTERYLRDLSRASELLTQPLPAGLVAFVAEELPGSIMRGVPREEWRAAGDDDSAVRASATANTERRFQRLVERVRAAERLPADGWRISADPLFQASVLTVEPMLRAFSERAGGEVLFGVPDRGVALALPASLPAAERFAQRVRREYREAMNPLSSAVLVSDGSALRERGDRRSRVSGVVMPWLED